MKKIIYLLICFTMFLPTVDIYSAKMTESINKETEVLSALGIFPQASPGENTITRAQFAYYLSTISFLSTNDAEKTDFVDVTDKDIYRLHIYAAAQAGAMQGRSKYIFAPSDPVTLAEASKAILYILGYSTVAENEGGFPVGYLSVASRTGLTLGVKNSGMLSQSAMYKLFYNALEIPFAERTSYGNDYKYKLKESDDTLLKVKFSIKHKKNAIVTANNYTSLNSSSGLAGNRVMAGGEIYIDNKNITSRLLGYSIDFYYSDDDSKFILYSRLTKFCEVLKIPAMDVVSASTTLVEYMDNEAKRKVNIPIIADYIFNSVYTEYHELTAEDFKGSSFVLIDADGDGEYETIHIEKCINYVVDSIKHDSKTIYDRFTGNKIEFEINNPKIHTMLTDGTEFSFNSINVGNLLSVAVSKNTKVINIYVSAKSFGGTIEAISGDEICIDGEFYSATPGLRDSKYFPKLGDVGACYIDRNGYIGMFIKNFAAGVQRYGYIMRGGFSRGLDKALELRILDQTGTITDYKVAPKCMIDGVRALGVSDVRYNRLKIDYQGEMPVMRDNIIPQLIKYVTSDDGVIINIYTQYKDENENDDTLYSNTGYISEAMYLHIFMTFAQTVAIDQNTIVFHVPSDYTETRDVQFYTKPVSSFVHNERCNIIAYNENEVNLAKALVVYSDSKTARVNENTNLFLVDYVSAYSDGNEVFSKVYGYYKGQNVSYLIDEETLSATLPANKNTLQRGDILKISTNSENRINGLVVKYNVLNRYNVTATPPYNMNWYTATYDMLATVYRKKGEHFIIGLGWNNPFLDIDAIKDYLVTTIYRYGGFYIFDEAKNEVRIATVDDLESFAQSGEDASRIYCRFDWGQLSDLVIIKLQE